MHRSRTLALAGLLLVTLVGSTPAQPGYAPPMPYGPPGYPAVMPGYGPLPIAPVGYLPAQAVRPMGYPMQPMIGPSLVQQVYIPVSYGEAGAAMPAGPQTVQAVALPLQPTAGSCASGDCGSCATAPCAANCCECGPRWYISAEALWLERSRSQRVFLGEEQDAVAATVVNVLSTEDTDFDYQPGIRILVGRRLSDTLSAEVSYFGLHDWNSAATLANSNPAANSLFSNFLALGGGIPDAFTFNYSSELHNAELNLRSLSVNDRLALSLLGGVRYINLSEECVLGAGSAVLALAEETRTTTNNHLTGLQFGGEAAYRLGDRWSLAALGKGGLFMNFANQHVSNVSTTAGTSTLILDTKTSGTGLAGAVEAGLLLRCRLSDSLTVRGGYQVLYLTGLALAPEQFGSLNNDLSKVPQTVTPGRTGAFLEDRGSALFHGPAVGFEVAW